MNINLDWLQLCLIANNSDSADTYFRLIWKLFTWQINHDNFLVFHHRILENILPHFHSYNMSGRTREHGIMYPRQGLENLKIQNKIANFCFPLETLYDSSKWNGTKISIERKLKETSFQVLNSWIAAHIFRMKCWYIKDRPRVCVCVRDDAR